MIENLLDGDFHKVLREIIRMLCKVKPLENYADKIPQLIKVIDDHDLRWIHNMHNSIGKYFHMFEGMDCSLPIWSRGDSPS